MKRTKCKIGCAMVSAAVCAVLLTACADSTDDDNQITITVKVSPLVLNCVSNPQIDNAFKFMEQACEEFSDSYTAADVNFDVELFEYVDEAEAITGSFDTDYATDILFEDYFNMTAYVHTGKVVPLDDIITDDIKNDISDSAWEISSLDGRVYMMPYLSRQNILIYNKSLMQSCGLDGYVSDSGEIQSWSIDEWTEILDTLAEKLPTNVYPMMMYAKNNQGDTHIMSLIRAFGSSIFDSDGNFDFESKEAVNALEWIQNGVQKGWYPKHRENLEIMDNQELFENNQLVFYLYNNANYTLYDDISDYGFVNFPNSVATSFITGFEVFDNGDDEKVKVSKDFVKYIYETDKWLELSAGNIPESSKVAEKYQDEIPMLSTFTDNADNVVDFMNSSPNWQGSDDSVRSVFYTNIHALLMGTITPSECAAALDSDCNDALKKGWKKSVLHE